MPAAFSKPGLVSSGLMDRSRCRVWDRSLSEALSPKTASRGGCFVLARVGDRALNPSPAHQRISRGDFPFCSRGVPSGPGKRTGAPEELEVHVCLVYKEAAKGWGCGEQAMHRAELRIECDACTAAEKRGAGARPPSSAWSTEPWGFSQWMSWGKRTGLFHVAPGAEEALGGQLRRGGLHLAMNTDLWTVRVT